MCSSFASPTGVLSRVRIAREAEHFSTGNDRVRQRPAVDSRRSAVWIGDGTHKPCVVCRLRIDGLETQYDVAGPRGALPVHITCYRIWRAQSDMRRDYTRP